MTGFFSSSENGIIANSLFIMIVIIIIRIRMYEMAETVYSERLELNL